MQNLKAGHAGTASSGLNHNGLSHKGNFSLERRSAGLSPVWLG